MGFFGLFGLKKAPSAKQKRDMLPSLHSFVDVSVKNGPKGSVCFENSGASTFITSVLPGMSAGQTASFVYSNSAGKYRFSAAVKAVDAKQAVFTMPGKIETVQKFGGAKKRTNVRVDSTIPTQWRYASAGKLESVWQKGTLSDISRTGSSLAADKAVKSGDMIELKAELVRGTPTLLRGQAKRVEKIEGTSKYNVGLSFSSLGADGDRAITEFINRRQVDLRNRGLG